MTITRNSVKNQYYATICVNIISVSYGSFCGWPSASFLILQSEDSPLETGPMNNTEAGWVGSMVCVGGILGNIFFAWLSDIIGRKRCLLLTAIPAMIGWFIIPWATTPTHLCLSRFFGGFAGGGTFSLVPIYITEISEDCIRGKLGSFLVLSCNFGFLLAFMLGSYFSYGTVALILSTLSGIFLIFCSFLPETPQYLLMKNKEKEARNSLSFFRTTSSFELNSDSEIFQSELEKLRGDNKTTNPTDNNRLVWQDFNNRIARKALFIGIALAALNQFCGLFAMLNYTATIFQQSGSNLSPNISAIVVGAIQLIGSYMSTMLVERSGRKFLLAISSIGSAIGLISLGMYTNLTSMGHDLTAFNWIPVASFSFTIFIACWGILTLPFLVISEIMPPRIRSMGCMICMSFVWIFAFFLLKFLPQMTEVLGMHGVMFSFGGFCLLGAAFVVGFVPETRGKSIEAIMELL